MALIDEIFEQPQVVKELISQKWEPIQSVAREIHKRDIRFVFLAARGTSDHAGIYLSYLWGAHNHLATALATPSLFSIYDQPPSLKDALVVGISQSGQSPDIVSVLQEGKKQGSLTLSFTNDVKSPLAESSDHVIDISAGLEKAVAATKTYTTSLASIALLSTALSGSQKHWEELQRLPEYMAEMMKANDVIKQMAERYRYMSECVICGRGFNYATAYEWSLKLKELAYIVSVPYSSADFRHGPIAIVNQGFPIFAVMPKGAVYEDLLSLIKRLKQSYQTELLVISDEQEALDMANTPIQLPAGIPEWLTPIVSILPAQLFTYYLTKTKGYDTETPPGLRKVTETL